MPLLLVVNFGQQAVCRHVDQCAGEDVRPVLPARAIHKACDAEHLAVGEPHVNGTDASILFSCSSPTAGVRRRRPVDRSRRQDGFAHLLLHTDHGASKPPAGRSHNESSACRRSSLTARQGGLALRWDAGRQGDAQELPGGNSCAWKVSRRGEQPKPAERREPDRAALSTMPSRSAPSGPCCVIAVAVGIVRRWANDEWRGAS